VLRQRIITALLLGLPLLAMLLLAPPQWILPVLAGVLLLGAWEWSGFLQTTHPVLRIIYVLVMASGIGFWYLVPELVSPYTLLFIAVLWWIAALGWIVFAPHRGKRWATALAGIFVLLPMWIALGTLLLHHARGAQFILCLLLLVISTDIGGYFFGRAFGKHKLAPQVSPGKTWEGAAGGVTASLLIAALAAHWFDIALIPMVVLSLIAVIFSIVGDLTESMFKRHAGLKDSSNILPGHGGILDRIDSITAAAPVFVYGLIYLNVVTL
jgi:phosphatidate cytidylyltransferase